YSRRPGTPAAAMSNQIPVPVARERNRLLRESDAAKELDFMRRFAGETIEAIRLNVSGKDSSGEYTEALTDNYLQLKLRGKHQSNRWIPARIDRIQSEMLVGVAA